MTLRNAASAVLEWSDLYRATEIQNDEDARTRNTIYSPDIGPSFSRPSQVLLLVLDEARQIEPRLFEAADQLAIQRTRLGRNLRAEQNRSKKNITQNEKCNEH